MVFVCLVFVLFVLFVGWFCLFCGVFACLFAGDGASMRDFGLLVLFRY